MIHEKMLHPRATIEHAGFIPVWLNDSNPAPIKEQLHRGYSFAGGWRNMNGFTIQEGSNALYYPGDPPLHPIIEWTFDDHKERLYLYAHSIVAIFHPDGRFEVCRMD
jgi:hypothetical protein